MTTCRYPPVPYDWEEAMRLHEDRLDDHLTDGEVRDRLAALDRTARRPLFGFRAETPQTRWDEVSCADPLGAAGTETFARHGRPYIRSALGVLGIVVAVCGIGAILFGLAAHGAETDTSCSIVIGAPGDPSPSTGSFISGDAHNIHIDLSLDPSPWIIDGKPQATYSVRLTGNCRGVTLYPMIKSVADQN